MGNKFERGGSQSVLVNSSDKRHLNHCVTGARYLLRFDDICPTMNWKMWDVIEELLIHHDVAPILAIVPENLDKELIIDEPMPNFWERVRIWQARGWSIGLHGYQHRYVNTESGILKLNKRSEFAGLSYLDQSEKITRGLSIFTQEGVRADCWIAPSHSFDWLTVEVLAEHGVRVISDGFALAPYHDQHDSVWIPQQFARMRSMPAGVWTFCYHHNGMNQRDLKAFCNSLKKLSSRMISLNEAVSMCNSKRSPIDYSVAIARRIVSLINSVKAAGKT